MARAMAPAGNHRMAGALRRRSRCRRRLERAIPCITAGAIDSGRPADGVLSQVRRAAASTAKAAQEEQQSRWRARRSDGTQPASGGSPSIAAETASRTEAQGSTRVGRRRRFTFG